MQKYLASGDNIYIDDRKEDEMSAWRPLYLASEVDARIDKLEEALQQIAQWGDAYPIEVFPEPDFKRVRAVLEVAGLSLDGVSASNMRHVVTRASRIARTALVE